MPISLYEDRRLHTMVCYRPIRLLSILILFGMLASSNRAQEVAGTASTSARLANATHASTFVQADTDLKFLSGGSRYTLGVSDVIRVNVWKNNDLSQTVTVGPDGFVSLPLLGDVHVVGMTANQVALALRSKLNSYMVNPEVTVSVVDIRSRQVYVMGQVAKPGGYPLVAPVNVLQMIAQAGGLSTFANRKNIYVLRATNGHTQKLLFNYSKVIRGDSEQNYTLQPGDTVVVP